MACIRVDGYDLPVLFPVEDGGRARIPCHLLHVRFKLVESSIYVEEERMTESGRVQQLVTIPRCVDDGIQSWFLAPRNYRAYGLPLSMLCASTEIRSRQSDNSTVDMPYVGPTVSSSPPHHVFPVLTKPTVLREVKVEKLDVVIELSSDSEGECPDFSLQKQTSLVQIASTEMDIAKSESTTPSQSHSKSSVSRPPLHPHPVARVSIFESLKKLATMHRCRNELSTLDFNAVKHHRVQFLPPVFDGDVIFELPPCRSSSSTSAARNLEGMDKRYDGHLWCKVVTTNINNTDSLKFRKSYCAGHVVCENADCDYLKRASKRNETEWTGYTVFPFSVGSIPPKESTIVCKVCKTAPTCLRTCNARIYYSYSENPEMSRAAIHFGEHRHPIAKGMYRDSTETICGLIAGQVEKTPKATNSAIALSASKEFLTNYLFHNGEGEKEMLKEEEMEEVMDRFEYLSSPNIRNVISSFRSNNRGGIIDNIMTMKRESKFEFIHDSVFPGQGKEKVYIFKMLTEGPGSGVDLVRRMQQGGDLQNAWLMFDHVRRVDEWSTMACHVYDTQYKKVMTIAMCDMQSEDTEVQVQFWRSLNAVMQRQGVDPTNFKGFMADSAMANWNAVRIVYGSGSANVEMENRERTCLLHWSTSLHKHTQKYIKEAFQQQHISLCKQYKDSKNMDQAEIRYLAIRSWWLSSGAADEEALHHLDHWLAFWHFRYRQWGGFMNMKLNLEEMLDLPSCNLSETVHNKWLQMSGKRGNNLFDATCDDSIRAWMQMTNYRAYLKGHASGSGPSKGELKLRVARRSGDPKKIAEALNTLPGAEGVGTRVPHLEGEEIFGSTKRKLDVPIGDAGDSHRPDKVNFSQPRVRTRSTTASAHSLGDKDKQPEASSPGHVTIAFESDCDTSKWHIARISHKSNARCQAQQHGSNIKCTAKIARGKKGTPAPTYRGRKEEYGSKREVVADFWFCWDDIERCVKGTKRKWVIDWPEVPEVWPVLIGTNLNREETLLLQHAGFRLQTRPTLSPRQLFHMSKIFEPVLYDQPPPKHPDAYPTVRNNRTIRRVANAPTAEQRNKWESAGNVRGQILQVTLLPFPGLGAIVVLETGTDSNKNAYRVTMGMFPTCTCPDFVNMAVSAIGGRQQYVNCKHLYYLYRYFCKMDVHEDKFIHAPSYSFNELKLLLVRARIITLSE